VAERKPCLTQTDAARLERGAVAQRSAGRFRPLARFTGASRRSHCRCGGHGDQRAGRRGAVQLGRGPGEAAPFLGALTAGLGAGSIVAGLSSGRMINRFGERRLALLGLANFIVGNLMYATGWLPAALAGAVVLGFALPWSVMAVINLTQRRTPDALQGRVAAVVTLALFAATADSDHRRCHHYAARVPHRLHAHRRFGLSNGHLPADSSSHTGRLEPRTETRRVP
jgi:hypothetical protein